MVLRFESCNLCSESLHSLLLSPCSQERKRGRGTGKLRGLLWGHELRPKNEVELTRPRAESSSQEAEPHVQGPEVGWEQGRSE